MLLVPSPTNSTQVDGSDATTSSPNLELSRIDPISIEAPHKTITDPSALPQDTLAVPVPLHQEPQVQTSHQVTSVQPVDMALTGLVETTMSTTLHKCHCGKECTRYTQGRCH